jgi:hypothetical protein
VYTNSSNIRGEGLWTYLGYGISARFASQKMHYKDDSWTFIGFNAASALPVGASATIATKRSGSPDVNQLALSPAFKGKNTGLVESFKVPPVFRVAAQKIDVFKVSTALATDTISFSSSGTCHSYDANDYDMETELNNLFSDFCDGGATRPCVSVVRSVDGVNNAGGYVYSIYFEAAKFASLEPNPTASLLSDIISYSGCSGGTAPTASQPSERSFHNKFTRYSLPLAPRDNKDINAYFRGIDVTKQSLYKVNGHLWAVTFDSNLGDLNSLVAAPTSSLTAGTDLHVYDDVVTGVHPLTYDLEGLNAGLDYSVRVKSYTRGTNHGYSAYSTPLAMDTPSAAPPAIFAFSAKETLKVDEVQDVILAAKHINEVQHVTTSAAKYPEVQEIALTVDEGFTASGSFSLRFPEVQEITVSSSAVITLTDTFTLTYTNAAGSAITSGTIMYSATSADIKAVIEGLSNVVVGSVEVVKSGTGGYSSNYGFTWSVSFVGNDVAGNVLEMVATETSPNSAITLAVTTTNNKKAVGTDTEIEEIVIFATDPIAQGQYKLDVTYNGFTQVAKFLVW